jgi:hypothetical protein
VTQEQKEDEEFYKNFDNWPYKRDSSYFWMIIFWALFLWFINR